jgi:hypothetical protein
MRGRVRGLVTLGRSASMAWMLVAAMAGCASPGAGDRVASGSLATAPLSATAPGFAAAPPAATVPPGAATPRFAPDGPDAAEYGARDGYAIGDRTTFFRLPYLVGSQTWIFPGPRRMFALLGVRGQSIFVDPTSRLVMVHTAVRKQAVDPGVRETGALWRGVVEALGEPER